MNSVRPCVKDEVTAYIFAIWSSPRLPAPVDLLVATPGRLLQHLDRSTVYFGDVRHVVIDEVDTMFESGFGEELERILTTECTSRSSSMPGTLARCP